MHAGAEIAAKGLVEEVGSAWGNLELKLPKGHLSDGIVVVPDLQALLGLNDGAPWIRDVGVQGDDDDKPLGGAADSGGRLH
jgi:hypothetical protein